MPATELNRYCHCITLDRDALEAQLRRSLHQYKLSLDPMLGREQLFAPYGAFISGVQQKAMAETVRAVDKVISLPAFAEQIPDLHRYPDQGTRGLFTGIDFHPTADGASLIEINTNAGGAFLSALMTHSQHFCCDPVRDHLGDWQLERVLGRFEAMFRSEWRLARGEQPLESVLIVDEAPQQQYLYPEFLLFRNWLRDLGIDCEIAAPEQLHFDSDRLCFDGRPFNLVYNRLTDFPLSELQSRPLRDAYLADAAVVTPNPRHHLLYANKRNLILLSDDQWLTDIGVDAETRSILQMSVPESIALTAENAEVLWARRKQYFFKPYSGYGSKAAYRGDKLTRCVWQQLLEKGDYLAQAYVPAAQRYLEAEGKPLKFDVRTYVYGGEHLLTCARLYQGQTTNFRTAGGGFAAVFGPPRTSVAH
ncbi:hypothetical protein [Microbulbifer taiwanensis]|uniref:Circularly permuted type 2 ATP-grasp protein n=1 Tax=Microbulbifer taiwanensis TaxID=986746 RepID=A0ABW1YRA2_9GAMM|nr:hypothetical protein [Microbulbifer taiwanensis]